MLRFRSGEDSDNAQTYSTAAGNISSRPLTDAAVNWTPPNWNSVGASGLDQRTPDLSAIIQEIVNRPGWTSGHAVALALSGSGRRTAESINGKAASAPLLHIEFALPSDGLARIDLDVDNSTGGPFDGYATVFFPGDSPIAIADNDTAIDDSDSTTFASARITITDPRAGDMLSVGALPGGITVDAGSTATEIILTGNAPGADYEAAVEAVAFENPLAVPEQGTRTIEVTINDGTSDGPASVTTLKVLGPGLQFTVIADSPYSDGDFQLLEEVLTNLPEQSRFVIHLGDIKSGSKSVDIDTYYDEVASTFGNSTKPFFLLLGDNEYNDMPDPEAAYAEWQSTFLYYDQNWAHNINVTYQDVRPENFSFVIEDTLFLGFNMVGGKYHDAAEWDQRAADNLIWLEDNFAQFGDTTSNAIMFGQANFTKSGYEVFEAGFYPVAQDYDKPILYLQGDLHTWSVGNPYGEAPNVTRIVVDKTTSTGRVLEVGVTDDPDIPFSWEHGLDPIFV